MKKLLFTTVLMVSALCTANAVEIKFGLQAGVNHNALSEKLAEPFVHQLGIGFYAGGHVEIFLLDQLSITPELQYAMVTTTDKASYLMSDASFSSGVVFPTQKSSSISQLELPIMLGFYPIEGFKIELGPRLSYILGGTFRLESKRGNDEVAHSSNVSLGEMNRFNVGIGLGFGYRFDDNFELNGLGINARCSLDFLNRYKSDGIPGGTMVGGVQLGLSYQF